MSGPKGIDYFIGDGTPSLAGDAFVVIKASEGAGYPPPGAPELAWYPQQQARARSIGALFGAFHFWHPGVDNAAQVVNFAARANLAPGDLIQLDAEVTDGLDWATVNARKNDMLARLKAAFPQCRVLLYTYLDYWNHIDANAGDGLWIADPSAPAGAPRVAHWVIHQYASDSVDYDIANFPDGVTLRAWATGLIPQSPEVLPMEFIANVTPNPNPPNDQPGIWLWNDGKYAHVAAPGDNDAFKSIGIKSISISYGMHQALLATQAVQALAPAASVEQIAHAAAVELHNDLPAN